MKNFDYTYQSLEDVETVRNIAIGLLSAMQAKCFNN